MLNLLALLIIVKTKLIQRDMSLEVRNGAPYRAKRSVENRTVPVEAVWIWVRKAPALTNSGLRCGKSQMTQ